MTDHRNKEFIRRHIGPSSEDQKKMLSYLGYNSLEEFIKKIVPEKIIENKPLDIDEPVSEHESLNQLKQIASQNKIFKSFIGMGYYGTYTPNVILRNILENPGWYTSYTPYQPEVAQGRLEMLLNFQQMVMDLTGMDIANASLLDEGTAAAEAVALCQRVDKNKLNKIFISKNCNPQTIDVVKTRAEPFNLEVIIGNDEDVKSVDSDILCGLYQYPNTYGEITGVENFIKNTQDKNGKAILISDLLALTVLKPPGEMGADIVVGNSQRFGIPMGYGGPHAAFFATKDEFKRAMPGRLIGVSKDRNDNQALRMALQTREQHIRREKATSNICTAQALLSIMAAAYGIYHGPEGIRHIGERTLKFSNVFAEKIKTKFEILSDHFFDTVTINTKDQTNEIYAKALEFKVNLRLIKNHGLSVSFDETTKVGDLNNLFKIFGLKEEIKSIDNVKVTSIENSLKRETKYLTHKVFNSYHSETEMLRYLKSLEDKDIALNRSMIALGSCTMKLNAVAEMIPVTWPEFGNIHPFAPLDQTKGYSRMFSDLEMMLSEITGFSGISLQPNAGAQGEYAGLMVIRKYHIENGDKDRNICLIPSSAHGTNPASAQMAGMKVIVVDCDKDGNVDLDDLTKKADLYSKNLAALMVTYPSTHGVFEEHIKEICNVIHKRGGQVYMDGANLNALVGVAKPGKFGPDVCHMNLHKTFCIPHGGGGPGMGPIGVGKHLEPFLPNHVLINSGPTTGMGSVSAAPWGSASILPISWMYIKMMGAEGLRLATEVAILNANYISKKLEGSYKTLYKGKNNLVAHECIIDFRPIKAESGISEEDIAKRLIDYGYHAPTMSWPVAGTLMIEPTESESLAEMDKFCNAFISIRKEVKMVQNGVFDKQDNPLKNAPHTNLELSSDSWTHQYTREQAAFPLTYLKANKFWPPVARVDNVHGDRNLICSCPSLDSYRDDEAA
ncbi:MAG: aminomethyl-transferring glycine dehydrogenase [Pelagibacteraceae bacterium]|nr:aminomethyl-transferring glycine dehydrogenase [Pelagibacteraceae bacterium]